MVSYKKYSTLKWWFAIRDKVGKNFVKLSEKSENMGQSRDKNKSIF